MDYTPQELEDLATMHELLGRLRACAVQQVEACEQMDVPKTGLEMQRRSRAIRTTADLVVTLYSPAPRRSRKVCVRTGSAPEPSSPPPAKPRPSKPEPSPFMQSMDDIERSLKQIVGAKTALDDVPDGMEVPPALAEALSELSKPAEGPTPLQDQAIALARFNKELATAKALHRLNTAAARQAEADNPPPALDRYALNRLARELHSVNHRLRSGDPPPRPRGPAVTLSPVPP